MDPRSDLDEILRVGIGRDTDSLDPHVHALVTTTFVIATRAQKSRRKQLMLYIPVASLGTLALTGGAYALESAITADVEIPVTYTIEDGSTHDCVIWVDGGSLLDPGTTVIGDALRGRDWTGVGQLIWERATSLANSLGEPNRERDRWAWAAAEIELTVMTAPETSLPAGEHAVVNSDCSGILR